MHALNPSHLWWETFHQACQVMYVIIYQNFFIYIIYYFLLVPFISFTRYIQVLINVFCKHQSNPSSALNIFFDFLFFWNKNQTEFTDTQERLQGNIPWKKKKSIWPHKWDMSGHFCISIDTRFIEGQNVILKCTDNN